MSVFKLTESRDLDISSGNFELVSGVDEGKELILGRLKTFEGEWFLNPLLGVPYLGRILEKIRFPSGIQSLFIEKLGEIRGIQQINVFDLAQEGQTLFLDLSVMYNSEILTIEDAVLI